MEQQNQEGDDLVTPFDEQGSSRKIQLNAEITNTTNPVGDFQKLDSRTEMMQKLIDEIDWYGNTTLHHAYANDQINLPAINAVLQRYPQYASARNQFGRVPLHYAVDRCKCDMEGIKALISCSPDCVSVVDHEGITPYDLAVKWKHSSTIRRILLKADPSLDPRGYNKLTYGPILSLFMCNIGGGSAATAGNDTKRVIDESAITKTGLSGDEEEMEVKPFRSQSGSERNFAGSSPALQVHGNDVVDTDMEDIGFDGDEEKNDDYDRSDQTNYSHQHQYAQIESNAVEQIDDLE